MKKQAVLRKTLANAWTEFAFQVPSNSFFVKNFTSGAIYVSFVNNDDTDECFKILSNMGEELCITRSSENPVTSIYVNGTGEVEVQALDSYVTVGGGADVVDGSLVVPANTDITNGVLDVSQLGNVVGNTLELLDDSSEEIVVEGTALSVPGSVTISEGVMDVGSAGTIDNNTLNI